MKATHIYINAQGVPCAPTLQPANWENWENYSFEQRGNIVDSCIPIREEDRELAKTMAAWESGIKLDSFHSVEPYEFEKTSSSLFDWDDNYPVARIIRPSEPKAGPSKELRNDILKILESDAAHNHWDRYHEVAGYMQKEKTFDYDRAADILAEFMQVQIKAIKP